MPSPRLPIPAQTLDGCLPSLHLDKKAHLGMLPSAGAITRDSVIPGQVCLESSPSDINDNALLSGIKATVILKGMLTQQKSPNHQPICK